MNSQRVVSGMRPTGPLHLGHLHGVLNNWLKLQQEYDCFFFVADWHALTTHYEQSRALQAHVEGLVVDWLSVGVNPGLACLFVQSHVPQHAELFLLLSMIAPLSWLERVPTYKEQQEKLSDRDLSTYGFLGYPLLQAADVLIYKANFVPVGEDQLPHIELTREIARRFNHVYGKDSDYIEKAENAIEKLGKKNSKLYREMLRRYQEVGEQDALENGQAFIEEQENLSISDKKRLLGFLEGTGKVILPEPKSLLTATSKFPGLDGQKMSKSYNNCIYLRDTKEMVERKIATMPTDPQRVRRSDPGTPEKCPVWEFHKIYSSPEVKDWVQAGCTSAGIGCLECKHKVIDAVNAELEPIRQEAKQIAENPQLIRSILTQGAEAAQDEARETLEIVREAIGL